jgi:hypothetical protein
MARAEISVAEHARSRKVLYTTHNGPITSSARTSRSMRCLAIAMHAAATLCGIEFRTTCRRTRSQTRYLLSFETHVCERRLWVENRPVHMVDGRPERGPNSNYETRNRGELVDDTGWSRASSGGDRSDRLSTISAVRSRFAGRHEKARERTRDGIVGDSAGRDPIRDHVENCANEPEPPPGGKESQVRNTKSET